MTRAADLSGGTLLFLVSTHEVVKADRLAAYEHALVLHASDLPEGRGWSPHIWSIVEGRRTIVVSLLEAVEPVDTGAVWAKRSFTLGGHELHDEINAALFAVELELLDFAVARCGTVVPVPQPETGASYRRRRTPEDSRIDIDQPLRSQFPILQVADPERFPAFFEKDGFVYEIILRKRPAETETGR
ncbi:UDP-glucuronic acid dehydrogenase [Methylobacterium sp. J-026]|uniref:UDP-glucuronic acid dehydrogenase n=1 Tax=Methylobacterium sp. J-026 TaxID=2836624 RepID=UPI001FBC06EB|nr:UDP-glucuronic acid dehydrogenase [Methylobacterium sp. J-026]MCJ2136347.1 UDP-glucuronic acid dehydrogenase [Methylobacterium sp. J-026]